MQFCTILPAATCRLMLATPRAGLPVPNKTMAASLHPRWSVVVMKEPPITNKGVPGNRQSSTRLSCRASLCPAWTSNRITFLSHPRDVEDRHRNPKICRSARIFRSSWLLTVANLSSGGARSEFLDLNYILAQPAFPDEDACVWWGLETLRLGANIPGIRNMDE